MKSSSTTDIVDALVSKGVLTEEEGKLISKGAKSQKEAQDKTIKGKLSISSALSSAELYGDIRVRHETRWASSNLVSSTTSDYTRNRERYKLTFGVKTESGNWYSDVAMAMGKAGRSDNATFGGDGNASQATTGTVDSGKEGLFVKRAMLGWKPTEWLALEAGRIANPLYTTELLWDRDLTLDGAAAKVNYKMGDTTLFFTGVAAQYRGDDKQYDNGVGNASANNVFIGQAGVQAPIGSNMTGKIAISSYTYGSSKSAGIFAPAAANVALGGNVAGTNNLSVIEVPAELNYKFSETNSFKLYGDWAINTDADERARVAGITSDAKNDDTAWLLGLQYQNQAGKKAAEGDYSARIWYQETGLFAVDPNAVDSDFFDSKINMKGAVFKAEYLATNNVYLNFAYGHGKRNNNTAQTAGVAGDTGYNLKDFDLLQLDLTYKF